MSKTTLQLFEQYLVPFLAVVFIIGMSLYGDNSFAAPENMVQELRGMADASTSINKTACYIIGTISAVVGIAMAVYKQSFMTFAASTGITYADFKGPSLITAAMLI